MAKILEMQSFSQFRDADSDGLVGLRGYMQYFQEMVSRYMTDLGKSLASITENYGAIWIYSKFSVELFGKAGYDAPLDMKLWLEPIRSTVRVHPVLEISCRGKLLFRGRLECCLFKPSENRIARFNEIEFPTEVCQAEKSTAPEFSRMPKTLENPVEGTPHLVQYTDLDMSHHMNNQLYISLFLNGFDSAWMEAHPIKQFEIHYQAQTYEGVTLRTLRQDGEGESYLRAVQPDGTVAASCKFTFA